MNVAQLIDDLRQRDIRVWADGAQLRYDAPAGAMTDELRDQLRSSKEQIIAHLQQPQDLPPPIERCEHDGAIPLSYAQQRLWFIDQLESGSVQYNLLRALKLGGALDVAALREALAEIIRRHDALRTTYTSANGRPHQHVAASLETPFEVVDLSHLSPEAQQKRSQEMAVEGYRRPFDLAAGPLICATLIKLSDREHVFLLAMHHIVSDGWSMGVLVRELTALYEAFAQGKPSPLPQLPIQYADYTRWQQQWLDGAVLDKQLGYWQRVLRDVQPLELPTDRPRTDELTYAGGHRRIALPDDLCRSLRRLARDQNATLFMVALAAFQVLLQRYTGQSDITVGTPYANRRKTELEQLIGFFVNTLVYRCDVADNPTFRQLLGRVRESVLEADAHQDLPFDLLVERLSPERDLGRNPLFQVMFAVQNVPDETFELQGVRIDPIEVENTTAKFDLTLWIEERDGHIVCTAEYAAQLFDAGTIDRLLQHYQQLLRSITAEPDRQISRLRVLPESERRQVLEGWNETRTDYERGRRIDEMFEQQVKATPDAIAVAAEEGQQSYAELNARANQVAHHLRTLGVSDGDRVGLFLERGLGMVAATLGILKAGGVYVPFDPGYPTERLVWMRRDAGVSVVLADATAGDAEWLAGDDVTRVGVSDEAIGRMPTDDPPRAGGPDPLAYVMYTSGSTGRPKGVCVRHRGVVRLVRQTDYVQLTERDVVLQFAPISFDAATFEIWAALLNGGKLVVFPPGLPSLSQLGGAIKDHGVTALWLTAPLFHQMVEEEREALAGVRYLLAGGDVLSVDHVRRMLEAMRPGCKLINGYGPTENTTFTCCHVMDHASVIGNTVPIGRPISNTRVYILDRELEPTPIGVVGELYAGGDGVAAGYLNRPELTAERFVPDPFGGGGATLYRTSDLARYRADGTIEFFGRRDNQVKVRGYRIELGEIESVLRGHEALGDVCVVVEEHGEDDKRIVAYAQAQPGQHPKPSELRSYMAQRTPSYMIPASFVFVDNLAKTPSGKIDRRALLGASSGAAAEDAGATRGPTETEARLRAIWVQVLGVEAVALDDNFFDLGGHSLLATRVIARIHDEFGVELPLRVIFQQPTVRGLAAEVDALLAEGGQGSALPSVTHDPQRRHDPFPLTDVQQAYWIGRMGAFDLGNIATHAYLELESDGLDIDRLTQAWQKVIDRHDMLRAVVLADGRQQVLRDLPAYVIEVDDLCGLGPDEREQRLMTTRQRLSHQVLPHDRWPLFEICASRLSDRTHRLHLSFDALILDGWSHEVMFREWQQFYTDPSLVLPPLELTFRDYVVGVDQMKEGETYRRAEQYWRERLVTLPAAPQLPLVKDPGQIARPRFGRRRGVLDAERWGRLKEWANEKDISPSALMLAIFSDVLRLWSKEPAFTLNLTLFNRLPVHPQVDDVLGDFTSLTLFESSGAADETFAQRAYRVQARLWDDLDHRAFTGVQVIRELAVMRDNTRAALMPVVYTSTLTLNRSVQGTSRKWLGENVFAITQTPQVWLDHGVLERDGCLVFGWDAIEELFPEGLLDDMFAAYRRVVDRLVDEPGYWDADWPTMMRDLLPPEQAAQRAEVNRTAHPLPDGLLHTAFAEQAARRADQPAVVAPGATVTYAQLANAANHLGQKLRDAGARPNQLVGVVMDKGWEQVAGAMAVLASGAAYLPIDADEPEARLHMLLEDGQVELIVTQPDADRRIDWPQHVQRFVVDATVLNEPAAALEPVQTGGDLAYVIYTSGSTGRPKGVMIDHRGALNTIRDVNERFGVEATDRVLAVSSMTFDLSVYDVFGTLAAGGTIVMPAASGAKDPAHWAELINQHGVTVWNSAPPLMTLLVEYTEGKAGLRLEPLRLVMLSGDWIPVDIPDRVRRLAEGARVISLGGATEASIWSIFYPIEAVDPDWPSIPYGKPMANQAFHVLNSAMAPCPTWVPGQLYIGGVGLAQGYWRDEHKTRTHFVTHPRTGERLYRTGDLGRYLPDGNIEFLGREDNQVKVQGHRVELGEVESVLKQHPAVRSVAVVATGDKRADRKLRACYVASAEGRLGGAEFRAWAQERLPAYMVPTAFVTLERMPLTDNGKLDRKALQAIEAADDALAAPAAGADLGRAGFAGRVAAIVGSVIGHGAIDATTNLLTLGATSVDIIRIANALDREIGQRPAIDEFYREPTIDALVRFYQAQGLGAGEPAAADAGVVTDDTAAAIIDRYELIYDPQQRRQFKEQLPGVRHDLAGRESVRLTDVSLEGDALAMLTARRSYREFTPQPIGFDAFSRLVGCLCATPTDRTPKYAYGSAGGLYPVQSYWCVKPRRIASLPGGIYYCHPIDRALIRIASDGVMDEDIYDPFINGPIYQSSAFTVFFVAQLSAIAPLYGAKSTHFSTIEAGLMSQLLEMCAPLCDIGLCQIGQVDFDRVRERFELDDTHVMIHSLVGGAVGPGGEAWSPYVEDYAMPHADDGDHEVDEI